jgi:serine/threonine-protein kinase
MSAIKIEGFEILSHLGTGGMASVWKARQKSLDREVAIKVLSSKYATAAEDIDRFATEARNVGRLKHAGIVQVYDAVFEEGLYCFVMEFVSGYTVGEWLRRKGRLSEREALTVADCVADALDYAWEQFGIVHCDIKPDNVMVDSDGSVKLTDLGLSRTYSALRAKSDELVEEVLGTPAYTSPEQAMGEPDLDCRADMYSLGAMLYHMVTGTMLFEGKPESIIMELQVMAHVPHPRTIEPALSAPFCNLIIKLLSKERKYRHANWKQVRSDIAAVRLKRGLPSGNPFPGRSTILPDPAAKESDRSSKALRSEPEPEQNRKLPILISLLILTAFLGIWLLAASTRTKQPNGREQPPPRPVATVTAAARMLAETEGWLLLQERPRESDVIRHFQRILDNYPDSPEARIARTKVDEMRQQLNLRIEFVMKELEKQTFYKIKRHEYDEASADYLQYSGGYAEETLPERQRISDELLERKQAWLTRQARERAARERAAREEAARAAHEKRVSEMTSKLVSALDISGFTGATEAADALTVTDPEIVDLAEFNTMRDIFSDAVRAEKAFFRSFIQQVGQNIEIRTRNGTITGKVKGVDTAKGDVLLTRATTGSSIEIKINQRDFTLRDRLTRMGSEDTPGERLAKAWVAAENGAYDYARQQAETLPESIKERVMRRIPQGR